MTKRLKREPKAEWKTKDFIWTEKPKGAEKITDDFNDVNTHPYPLKQFPFQAIHVPSTPQTHTHTHTHTHARAHSYRGTHKDTWQKHKI